MKNCLILSLLLFASQNTFCQEMSRDEIYASTILGSGISSFIVAFVCNLSKNKIAYNIGGLTATAGIQSLISTARDECTGRSGKLPDDLVKRNPITKTIFGVDVQMFSAGIGYALGGIMGSMTRSAAEAIGSKFKNNSTNNQWFCIFNLKKTLFLR